MKQQEKTRQTRRTILSRAAREFARRGFYGTTTRALSLACGFEQPTLYHHFGNKENLFREALLYTHRNIFRILEKVVRRDGALFDELASIFTAFEVFNQRYPGQGILVFSLALSGPEALVREYTTVWLKDYENLVRIAFERNPPDEPRETRLRLCLDLLFGLFIRLSGTVAVGGADWRAALEFALWGKIR